MGWYNCSVATPHGVDTHTTPSPTTIATPKQPSKPPPKRRRPNHPTDARNHHKERWSVSGAWTWTQETPVSRVIIPKLFSSWPSGRLHWNHTKLVLGVERTRCGTSEMGIWSVLVAPVERSAQRRSCVVPDPTQELTTVLPLGT